MNKIKATVAASFFVLALTLAGRAAEEVGLRCVVLAGGSFQNVRLLARLTALLREDGLAVLTPRRLPPNDGAVSYGQAAVAAARLARER